MDADVAEPLGPGDPREIGQFTVIGVLGAGGMGEVYLGTREGRYVAVKRVKPRLVSGERFNREVAILHRVPFGVAPSLLASDSTAPEPWFATEYVPGLTVEDAVRSFGPLAADALWLLLAETAAHLQAVHEAGIVHRDLKPANIMLVRDGVKLIDFGIALAGDQARLTRTGASSGTRGFTAPEQEAGDRDVSERADLYSLAATLIYAASARLPGALPDISTIRTLDPALAAVVEPCLAADPAARPTAAELVTAAHDHADAVSPSWSAPVMERIAKRRAFAATPVSVIDTVLPPDLEVATEPEPGPTQGLTDNGEAGRSRRTRVLIPLAAVAVFCVAVAGVLAALSSHGNSSTHSPSAASGIGIVPIAGTESSSAPPRSSQTTAPGPTSSGSSLTGSSSTGSSSTGLGSTTPTGTKTSSSKNGSGASTPSRPAGTTAPSTHPSSTKSQGPGKSDPTPTASSIPGINSADDPARVPNSEADTTWVANDAACSGWLDSDGSGNLAGVLNTSLQQSCVAEVIRSDGMTYTFSASHFAEKTNFLPDQGYTMQICVWHADEKDSQSCSPQFGMSGTSPVQK
ncbi:serine/threonine protein kinase [Catenulispora acidiphila DSM 44928]|uniref:non-specific serine/threonine protein kinase n=2 Tax=Catenulispora TaxID=414878 RepID=C7QFT0_CATAD|nr:serine/threonine protein kinase [Catenulispora acidiphila DSM 44928]